MKSFLEKQSEEYKYKNYLKSNLYLKAIGHPINKNLGDDVLKELHSRLRDVGYEQKEINTWFTSINEQGCETDGMLCVSVDGDQVFIFIEELPQFKKELWEHYYNDISLSTYVDFIKHETILQHHKDKETDKLDDNHKYLLDLFNIQPETLVLEEYITQQLYALGVSPEKLLALKNQVIEEVEEKFNE